MGQYDTVVKVFREREEQARKLLARLEGGLRVGEKDGTGWRDTTDKRKKQLEDEIAKYKRIADEWSNK